MCGQLCCWRYFCEHLNPLCREELSDTIVKQYFIVTTPISPPSGGASVSVSRPVPIGPNVVRPDSVAWLLLQRSPSLLGLLLLLLLLLLTFMLMALLRFSGGGGGGGGTVWRPALELVLVQVWVVVLPPLLPCT